MRPEGGVKATALASRFREHAGQILGEAVDTEIGRHLELEFDALLLRQGLHLLARRLSADR